MPVGAGGGGSEGALVSSAMQWGMKGASGPGSSAPGPEGWTMSISSVKSLLTGSAAGVSNCSGVGGSIHFLSRSTTTSIS